MRPLNILFLCVANSARSQMAEGLAKAMLGDRVVAMSAGSRPATLNPLSVRALAENGVDISRHGAKGIGDLPGGFVGSLDYVITLCEEEECPVSPSNAKKLSWAMPDPATGGWSEEERLQRFREARDEIGKKLERFAAENGIPIAGHG